MPRPETPALATQLSTWPITFTVSAKASIDLLLVADIDDLGVDLAAVALELLGRRVGLLLARAPDADIGARLGHRVGHAEADAAIAAGHQRHLAA